MITVVLAECRTCLGLTEWIWLDCDRCRERGERCEDFQCTDCGGAF